MSNKKLITGGWQGSIDSLIMSRYSNDSPQIPSPRPHWPQNSSDHCTFQILQSFSAIFGTQFLAPLTNVGHFLGYSNH